MGLLTLFNSDDITTSYEIATVNCPQHVSDRVWNVVDWDSSLNLVQCSRHPFSGVLFVYSIFVSVTLAFPQC